MRWFVVAPGPCGYRAVDPKFPIPNRSFKFQIFGIDKGAINKGAIDKGAINKGAANQLTYALEVA